MNRIRKAVIPAAGLGTRFLPATKALPKEMLPIVDKPAIQFIVEEAAAAGIESIMIVTGRNKHAIEEHFDKSFELESVLEARGQTDLLGVIRQISKLADIHYTRQGDALGLGHALLCAKTFIGDEPFAVLLGDDVIQANPPALSQLVSAYKQVKTAVIGVQRVAWEEVDKYGIVAPDSHELSDADRVFRVGTAIEKPNRSSAPSNHAIIGRYILTPDIFEVLEHVYPGKNEEYQLTDGLLKLHAKAPIYACLVEGKRYDIGDKLGYLKANIEFALAQSELYEAAKNYLRQIAKDAR